jgi:hypothetical protein
MTQYLSHTGWRRNDLRHYVKSVVQCYLEGNNLINRNMRETKRITGTVLVAVLLGSSVASNTKPTDKTVMQSFTRILTDTNNAQRHLVPADTGCTRKECTAPNQPKQVGQWASEVMCAWVRAVLGPIITLPVEDVIWERALAEEAEVLQDTKKRRQAAKFMLAACLSIRALGRSVTGADQRPGWTSAGNHAGAFELISKARTDILVGSIEYLEKVQTICRYPTVDIILHGVRIGALHEMARAGLVTRKDAAQLAFHASGDRSDLVELARAIAISSAPVVLLTAQKIRLGEISKERMTFPHFLAMVQETTRQSPITTLHHACAELISRSCDRPIQSPSADQRRPVETWAPDELLRSLLQRPWRLVRVEVPSRRNGEVIFDIRTDG